MYSTRMVHPLGYWWQRRAAQRQEERRRANRVTLAPTPAVPSDSGKTGGTRAWSSAELRDRYRRVLTMREAGMKFREIGGYIRIGNQPIPADRARGLYLQALNCRKRGII